MILLFNFSLKFYDKHFSFAESKQHTYIQTHHLQLNINKLAKMLNEWGKYK